MYIRTTYSVGIHSPTDDDDVVVRISMTLHFDIRYVVRK